jgi:hypothetical protein
MTVKEVKLQALRIMFADSDVEFSTNEYDAGTLNTNANTREKLVRMDDSIRRGIDLYNTLVEQETAIIENLFLASSGGVYANTIDISGVSNLNYPTRVDVFLYQHQYETVEAYVRTGQTAFVSTWLSLTSVSGNALTPETDKVYVVIGSATSSYINQKYIWDGTAFVVNSREELWNSKNQINYVYDSINRKIYFQDVDYAKYYNEYDVYTITFRIWYKVLKQNISTGNQDSINLDSLKIPSDVQNMLPIYIKGELYEEDDFVVAQTAKQEFARFLQTVRQPFNKVQTKVSRAKVFNK